METVSKTRLQLKDWALLQQGAKFVVYLPNKTYFLECDTSHFKYLASAEWRVVDTEPTEGKRMGDNNAKDPTRDLGAAMKLFLRLRFASIEPGGDGWRVSYGQATGEKKQGFAYLPLDPFDETFSEEEQLCLTILAAYYEYIEGVKISGVTTDATPKS